MSTSRAENNLQKIPTSFVRKTVEVGEKKKKKVNDDFTLYISRRGIYTQSCEPYDSRSHVRDKSEERGRRTRAMQRRARRGEIRRVRKTLAGACIVRSCIRNSRRSVAVRIDDYDDITPISLFCIIRGIELAKDSPKRGDERG